MWWPSALREGQDPDPRFTLANERTFLAWIRTALGLVATGAALEAFGADLLPGALRTGLVLGLLVLSAVLAVSAFVRWVRIETAMRRGASLPLPKAAVLVSAGLFVAVVAFTLGLFV